MSTDRISRARAAGEAMRRDLEAIPLNGRPDEMQFFHENQLKYRKAFGLVDDDKQPGEKT